MRAAGGTVGKAIVAGVKGRKTNMVRAEVVESAGAGATVFTDEWRAYTPLQRMGYAHRAVKHSVGQYVDDMAHTNSIASFWAMMKRGYHGTYYQVSPEHLHRYVAEFSGRHNQRPLDTLDQTGDMVRGGDGRQLTCQQLIANGVRAKRRMEEAA